MTDPTTPDLPEPREDLPSEHHDEPNRDGAVKPTVDDDFDWTDDIGDWAEAVREALPTLRMFLKVVERFVYEVERNIYVDPPSPAICRACRPEFPRKSGAGNVHLAACAVGRWLREETNDCEGWNLGFLKSAWDLVGPDRINNINLLWFINLLNMLMQRWEWREPYENPPDRDDPGFDAWFNQPHEFTGNESLTQEELSTLIDVTTAMRQDLEKAALEVAEANPTPPPSAVRPIGGAAGEWPPEAKPSHGARSEPNEDELAKRLADMGHHTKAALVRYMKSKERASLDEIKERVQAHLRHHKVASLVATRT